MARVPLLPGATAKNAGVTVSWTSTGRTQYQCSINLSTDLTAQLGLVRGRGTRVYVEYCAELNRLWARLARPTERGWGVCWKAGAPGRYAANLRITLPEIHGDKRPAQPVTYAVHQEEAGPVLEIDMPAWAQPPSARREKMQRVA